MSVAELGALAPIAARKRREVAQLHCGRAAVWAAATLLPPARAPRDVLRGGAIVAEMKRRSPSGGELRPQLDCGSTAAGYERAGAAAVSVLTDREDFGGGLEDLEAARSAVSIPVLRKDFVVDPLQVAEARVAGADWVLLIVAMLGGSLLDDCLAAARRCGAGALVEVHTEEEVALALAAGAPCIGINNRDLRSLTTDISTFSRLRPLVPATVPCVAESGVRGPEDAGRLVGEGADAVLAGEALMRAADPVEACAALVRAARAAADHRRGA